MYIWSLSLPFWPLSLPFCSPPAVWQACREHPKIATPYKSDTYKISVFSTCIRNDRWRTPPAKKAAKPRSQRAQNLGAKGHRTPGDQRHQEAKSPNLPHKRITRHQTKKGPAIRASPYKKYVVMITAALLCKRSAHHHPPRYAR